MFRVGSYELLCRIDNVRAITSLNKIILAGHVWISSIICDITDLVEQV